MVAIFTKLYRRFGQPPSQAHLHEQAQRNIVGLRAFIPPEQRPTRVPPKRVAVIGAGFAGLTAAYYLRKEGIPVSLFEARDRYGGRVHTDDAFINGRLVERGAELIGLNHPLWLMFAQRFELSLNVVTPEANFSGAGLEMPLCLNSTHLSAAQQQRIFSDMENAFVSLNADANSVDANNPWLHPAAAILDSVSVGDWLRKLAATRLYSPDSLQLLKFDLENDQTVDVDKQSYLGLLAAVKGGALTTPLTTSPSEYWTHTEVFRCANGNQSLADHLFNFLKEDLGNGFDIHLGTAITEIDANDDQIFCTPEREAQKQEPVPFDAVVVAVPAAVISSGAISITYNHTTLAPLVQSGPAAKYISEVKERYWIKHSLAPTGFHEDLGCFWEGTDNQAAVSGMNFDLSVFAGHSLASNMALRGKHSVRNLLDAVFLREHTAQIHNNNDHVVDWPSINWIGSGYSCPDRNQVTAGAKDFNSMYGSLVFAGEHTCMAFFGYMEGALQSGLRAASQLCGRKLVP